MTCRGCGQPLVYPAIEGTDGLCVWEAPGLLKRNSCARQASEWWRGFWRRRTELPPYTQGEWLVNVNIRLQSKN